MNDLDREHDREIERETYTAIYAVPDLVLRTAILRLFGQIQNDRSRTADRLEAIEANDRDRQKWFAVLRWFQTIFTALITSIAIIGAEKVLK